jgi:hypothetical protein
MLSSFEVPRRTGPNEIEEGFQLNPEYVPSSGLTPPESARAI